MGLSKPSWLMLLALAGAVGCGDGEGETVPVVPGAEPHVELGTGEAEFEPIEGEPTIEMAAGFQGGFHVWTSFLASGFDEERLDMVLVTEVDGIADSDLTMRATLRGSEIVTEDGEKLWTFAGYPGQVLDARCASGKRVRLSVTLSDSFGHEASDERHCIVTLDEAYQSSDCE